MVIKMKGKEAMTAETFDEDEYRDKLIGEGYSDESARTLAAKKKESFSATKIEIDLGSLEKANNSDDEEFEHLSPEKRKKRQKDRDKQQKERTAHRADRREQHEEVEESIPDGK